MPSGRDRRSIASRRRRAAPEDFDESWLEDIRERFDARYIDLTKIEDRRRWHPSKLSPFTMQPLPKGLRHRPRIIVVPGGHRLARFATYGERYSLKDVFDGRKVVPFGNQWETWKDHDTGRVYKRRDISRLSRLGFQHPWQVIICVRRRRRREVLHALRIAGKGHGGGKRYNRNWTSEVRC